MTKTVKVALLQDTPHLGKKDEVKSVALGYAKNWLIPQGLALLATPTLITQRERQKLVKEEKLKRERERYQEVIEKLDGFTLRLRPKKTKKGTLYAAINEELIREKLKEKGITIETKYLQLLEPIKKVGEYEITVVFSQNYQAKLKVVVQ